MRYTISEDYKFKGIKIRKYTNKGEIREEYLIYRDKNGLIKCDCFCFQREQICKHVRWFLVTLRGFLPSLQEKVL